MRENWQMQQTGEAAFSRSGESRAIYETKIEIIRHHNERNKIIKDIIMKEYNRM